MVNKRAERSFPFSCYCSLRLHSRHTRRQTCVRARTHAHTSVLFPQVQVAQAARAWQQPTQYLPASAGERAVRASRRVRGSVLRWRWRRIVPMVLFISLQRPRGVRAHVLWGLLEVAVAASHDRKRVARATVLKARLARGLARFHRVTSSRAIRRGNRACALICREPHGTVDRVPGPVIQRHRN